MPLFTHRKRVHLGCTRHHMNFNITIKEIQFKTNQYFLANSYYTIFRKENKKKKFKSQDKVIDSKELKNIKIDEKIKFRVCLLQDLTHRYLERYIEKEKFFYIRQITEVSGEEIYINCGYFILPIHKYANEKSGQDITIKFIDPQGKASGAIKLYIEHEEREIIQNYLPNLTKTITGLFQTTHIKQPLPLNIIEKNKNQLDYLKKRKCDSNYSIKYDSEDHNNNNNTIITTIMNDDNTYSESEIDDNEYDRVFNESFLISQQQQSRKSDNIDPCLLNFNEDEEVVLDEDLMMVGNISSPDKVLTGYNLKHHTSTIGTNNNSGSTEVVVGDKVIGANGLGFEDNDSSTASSITTSAKEAERAKEKEAAERAKEKETVERAKEKETVEMRASRRTHIPFALTDTTTTAATTIQPNGVVEEEEVWEQPPPEWFLTTADVPTHNHSPNPASKTPIIPKLDLSMHNNTKKPVHLTPTTNATATSSTTAIRTKSARELLTMSSEDDHEQHRTVLVDSKSTTLPRTQTIVSDSVHPISTRPLHTPPPVSVYTPHTTTAGATGYTNTPPPAVLSPGVSVKELRRNYESPVQPPVPLSKHHSTSTIELSPPPNHYMGITQSNLQQPSSNNTRPGMVRSHSDKSYSTLSTHEYIPKAPTGTSHPVKGKILVPVRLMSPEQESQYRHNSSGWQGSRSEYIPSTTAPVSHQSHRQLHRTATAPALSPVREKGPPSGAFAHTTVNRGMSLGGGIAAAAVGGGGRETAHHHHASPHRTASVPSVPHHPAGASSSGEGYPTHHHASPHRTASVPSMPQHPAGTSSSGEGYPTHHHASPHRTASVPSMPQHPPGASSSGEGYPTHQHASPHRTASVPSVPQHPAGASSSGEGYPTHHHASPHRTASVPSMLQQPAGASSGYAAASLHHSRPAYQAHSSTVPTAKVGTPPVHSTAVHTLKPSTSPQPVVHAPVHRTTSAPVMAPPIRLKSNEAVPQDYQRYRQQQPHQQQQQQHSHPVVPAKHGHHRRNLSNGSSTGAALNYDRYRTGDLSPTRDRHVYA